LVSLNNLLSVKKVECSKSPTAISRKTLAVIKPTYNMKSLEEIHKSCHLIFRKGFFEVPDNPENNQVTWFGPSKACKIYDKLTDGSDRRQDSIGENFNQLIQRLDDNWFEKYKPTDDLDYYFYNYFLLLYLFAERVDIIFNIISQNGKAKLFNDFQHNNFKTLRKINKWANFIKHPKEFLFTHWPTYYFEGDKSVEIKEGDVKIDTDFIFKHYFSETKDRPVILENNNKVFVEIPDLEKLTEEFCKEMNTFFDFVCSNQVVADFLKSKSTIENYFLEDSNSVKNDLKP
jgi:hypothetical protein